MDKDYHEWCWTPWSAFKMLVEDFEQCRLKRDEYFKNWAREETRAADLNLKLMFARCNDQTKQVIKDAFGIEEPPENN